MCFLICRWRVVYYFRYWKIFSANSVNLSFSLGCVVGIFFVSSNGRGYGDKFRRLLRLFLCFVSLVSLSCYRWGAVRRRLLSSW